MLVHRVRLALSFISIQTGFVQVVLGEGFMRKLIGHDIGNPQRPGSTQSVGDNGYDLVAGGSDIWENADHFHFACTQCEGDFEVQVRVEILEFGHDYTKAGLMVRESLEPGSPHFSHIVFPDNRARNNNCGGHESQFRLTRNGPSKAIYPVQGSKPPAEFPVNYPDVWIRITRKASVFEALVSQDGESWSVFAHHEQNLPVGVFVGLAVTSHDDTRTIRARFREFEIS